jgi:hypothetical protein
VPAQAAGASRTFVAAQGSDSNPCTFGQPCRSFQAAFAATSPGGEIDVLDPAGYGSLTITHAISIQGHGYAGLAVPSGDGITINAGASDKINLRGLLLDGVGTGSNGVVFNTGASLNIQDCVIRNFASGGISFTPTALSALFVSNTLVSDNIGGFGIKIANLISSPYTTTSAVLTRDELDNNGDGIDISPGFLETYVSIVDSVVANNADSGVKILNSAGFGAAVMLLGSSVINNNVGLNSSPYSGPCQIYAAHSTIFGNGTGLKVNTNEACMYTFLDNNLIANNTDGSFQGSPPLQ